MGRWVPTCLDCPFTADPDAETSNTRTRREDDAAARMDQHLRANPGHRITQGWSVS